MGMDRLRAVDPQIRRAIDSHLSLFDQSVLLEFQVDEGHPLQCLRGIWKMSSRDFEAPKLNPKRAGILLGAQSKYASQRFVFQRWNDAARTRGIEITVVFACNYVDHNVTYRDKGKVRKTRTVRLPKYGFDIKASPLPYSQSPMEFDEWLSQNLPIIPCPDFFQREMERQYMARRFGSDLSEEKVEYKADLENSSSLLYYSKQKPFLTGEWITLRRKPVATETYYTPEEKERLGAISRQLWGQGVIYRGQQTPEQTAIHNRALERATKEQTPVRLRILSASELSRDLSGL